jgi:uncharacterized OsmC-like protein
MTTQPAPDSGQKGSHETSQFSLRIEWIRDYEFRVRFDREHYPDLIMDEPPPLGSDRAPNPSRILAAAVGNCLCASLLFCARKSRVDVRGIQADVRVHYVRNEKGRLRIGRMEVEVAPQVAPGDLHKAERCLELFEDYCVVTQSVRGGIDIAVKVRRPEGLPPESV